MSDRPPERIRTALSEISENPAMNDGIKMMAERAAEFESPMAAKLTGVYMNPKALEQFDAAMDIYFKETKIPSRVSEIVVGGGLHAAIYCAIRVQEGHPKPLVIEEKERVGGSFAVSRTPTFYLNSRNRPGRGGIPGREESLNYIPGAIVQPADLSGEEYQTNSALAYTIRTALAMYARVLTGQKVMEIEANSVKLENGKTIKAARVINATGLGASNKPEMADGKHMVDAMEFFAMLDKPFALQGLKKVAVIGAGDSGKTVIEALIGQGPTSRFSSVALDYIEKIDWYGVPQECWGKNEWKSRNRSRYQGIAREIGRRVTNKPIRLDGPARLDVKVGVASNFAVGFDGAYVDGKRYDLVVWAGGFNSLNIGNAQPYLVMGRNVARTDSGIFIVGPAAQLPEEADLATANVPENTVAVFRYADRTAVLAMSLPGLVLGEEDPNSVPDSIPEAEVSAVSIDLPETVRIAFQPTEPIIEKDVVKERTIRGKDKKPYKVGDIIAKPRPERDRYGYGGGRYGSARNEFRASVLAITGSERNPKVKVRESNGYRNTKILTDPKQWVKVEKATQLDGKPTPVY